MRENDGHVHDDVGLRHWREEGDAVEDVHRQPAQGEEANDNGQGLGGSNLVLQEAAMVLAAHAVAHHASELDLAQLLPSHRENLGVDAQHDEQGQQYASEEVEVDHVAHVHYTLEEAF